MEVGHLVNQIKTWIVWRKLGMSGMVGDDTNGRIEVIEKEPTHTLILELKKGFTNNQLLGFEWWDKLKELFELHNEERK